MWRIAVLGAALVLSFQAHAAKMIWVYFPNSDISWTYGINDKNVVVGTYYAGDRTVRAFFGPPGGPYSDFQFDGATTGARSIDNQGNIIGISHIFDGEKYCEYVPFERTADKKIVQIRHGKTPLNGFVQGMRNGNFVGDTCDGDGNSVGYQGRKGKWRGDLDISIPSAQPRGINKSGTIIGQFAADKRHWHGFILKNGVASVVDFPGAPSTQLTSINDAGIAVDYWSHGYHERSFLLDTDTNTFTEIDFDRNQYGSAFATAINNNGLITINVGTGRGYVFCPDGTDCPGGQPAEVKRARSR